MPCNPWLAAALAAGVCNGAPAAERIVTLAPHLAELVCAAGGCERLVGVVKHTDFPERAARTAQVGDALNINLEQTLALSPDLLLAWDGGTAVDTVQRLRGLGLRVEKVRVRSLAGVAEALTYVGGLMHTQTAAALAAQQYAQALGRLRQRYARARKLSVMYQVEHAPIYTIGAQSPIDEAIRLCGGENVFARLPQIAAAVSLESVLAADPEVVVFAQQDNQRAIRELWARWPQARAQKSGNLYAMDANLLARQSPRLLDGVEQLCQALDAARAKQQ